MSSVSRKSPVVRSTQASPKVLPWRAMDARKLFRSARSNRSSKWVPGDKIEVTSRCTSLPGLASSV